MADLEFGGIDLAKNVFQLHGCSSTGAVIFRKQLKRNKLLSFISELPTCTIAVALPLNRVILNLCGRTEAFWPSASSGRLDRTSHASRS